jgi:hypothetical protein
VPTCFNLINRQFFEPSGDCCSSELDKKTTKRYKKKRSVKQSSLRAEVAVLRISPHPSIPNVRKQREEKHSCGGETSLRPEQFWEQ